MIPGLGSDAAVWQATISELAPDVDCRVGNTLSDDSLPAMAARILNDAPARFALTGVSMGGMVALEIMRLAPERVTRLMLCDTNARADTAEQSARRLATNAAMLAATDLAALAAPGIAYSVHADADQSVRNALMQMTLRVGAAVYIRQNNAMIARQSFDPVLATISVPTMLVVGANDLMTPVIMSEEISNAIEGAMLNIIPAAH